VLPQVIQPTTGPRKKIVVVGGGPGGLEAARVAAERGHSVVLFEAAAELGGQIVLAAKATWRRDLIGIVQWLVQRLEQLGVDVRLNTLAEPEDVLGEAPDVVIAATGGLPEVGHFAGSDLADTIWDILSGARRPGQEVLLWDESGGHASLSCAEFLAAGGAKVEIATPDRALGLEMSDTNLGAHMSELYRAGVVVTPDSRLELVERSGNKLKAVMANSYSGVRSERLVDQVIGDYGAAPNSGLYEALKPGSRNLGAIDLHALAAARPQGLNGNIAGAYVLYRVGDAWACRNIHAAMLDSMRLCKEL
jgi:NADPH-dependent 2,4-dienoyl-CoA reductase/sulfur reductase-like enzyme